MSQVRLNIIDRNQTLNGEVHGSVGDAVVAALAAELETIDELALALARFITPTDDLSPFSWFHQGEDFEPYDAGILVIDLAARVVAVDSSFSLPSAAGEVQISGILSEERAWVPYRLSADWLFVSSIPEYEGVCRSRAEERIRLKPANAREILFGRPLLEFIVQECLAARDTDDEDLFTRIHAKWLMTARDELQGRTPHEVLLAHQDFIDFELRSRELQWSFTGVCPPPLPADSNAYHHAGFGTHEAIIYYDLIRCLLPECCKYLRDEKAASVPEVVAYLEEVKAFWLESPNPDYSGTVPARYIENERRRIPFAISAREAIIDEDCPLCQMMAEDCETPTFRHLDGAHMNNFFEFSFYQTREEWEAEQKLWQEFSKEFEQNWKARQENRGDDEDSPWPDDSEPLIH